MSFLPRGGEQLVVDLPGEKIPATVRKVVSKDTAIVELTNQPLAKSHTYKLRELVPVRRTAGMLGETWQAITQTELNLAERRKRESTKSRGVKRAASRR